MCAVGAHDLKVQNEKEMRGWRRPSYPGTHIHIHIHIPHHQSTWPPCHPLYSPATYSFCRSNKGQRRTNERAAEKVNL